MSTSKKLFYFFFYVAFLIISLIFFYSSKNISKSFNEYDSNDAEASLKKIKLADKLDNFDLNLSFTLYDNNTSKSNNLKFKKYQNIFQTDDYNSGLRVEILKEGNPPYRWGICYNNGPIENFNCLNNG